MLLDCSARRFLLQYPSAGGSISCSHEQLVTEHISFAWCSVSAGNTFLTKPKGALMSRAFRSFGPVGP